MTMSYKLVPTESDRAGSFCLQLTVENHNSWQSIPLSHEECLTLAQRLISIANGNKENFHCIRQEVEEGENDR